MHQTFPRAWYSETQTRTITAA